MGARENKCQFSQNDILHTIMITMMMMMMMIMMIIIIIIYNSSEIWHSFSRTPLRNSLWCYYRWLITSLALEKCKKNAIFLKIFCHKVFVHWKLKLLNFLVDSVWPAKNKKQLGLHLPWKRQIKKKKTHVQVNFASVN